MKAKALMGMCLALMCVPAYADIDLSCEDLAQRMVDRLAGEGLLTGSEQGTLRAHEISLSLCSGAQATAQAQHEKDKEEALSNWFWESRADKPGNRRLRNLKR